MQVTLDRQQGANAWLTIGLREGKNREIRRAMAGMGFEVNRLIRISFGPFRLGTLAEGAVEEVRPRVHGRSAWHAAAGRGPCRPVEIAPQEA
jgi:23S rRNA pseudouridine2605 synthase